MEEVAETSPLQFLLIELSLGLARSAIQAGPAPQWRRRRGPSPVLRKEPGGLPVNLVLLKMGIRQFWRGLVHRRHDLRKCLCGTRSDRIRPLKRIGQQHTAIGPNLIVASLFSSSPGLPLWFSRFDLDT